MNSITISHRGRVVALAAPTRFWLAEHVAVLPHGHPHKRLVAYMALYARDVLTGDVAGPYHDHDAQRFARHALANPGAIAHRLAKDDPPAAALLGGAAMHELVALLAQTQLALRRRHSAVARRCGARRRRWPPRQDC